MRGRKPIPSDVKRRRGNPGRRKLNDLEPQPDNAIPRPPDFIRGIALDEWERVIARLLQQGRLDTTHRAVLVGYCQYWADWCVSSSVVADPRNKLVSSPPSKHDIERARARLKAQGKSEAEVETELLNVRGKPVPNPHISLRDKAFDKMLRCATEIGITPSSQVRIATDGRDPTATIESVVGRDGNGKVVNLEDFAASRGR